MPQPEALKSRERAPRRLVEQREHSSDNPDVIQVTSYTRDAQGRIVEQVIVNVAPENKRLSLRDRTMRRVETFAFDDHGRLSVQTLTYDHFIGATRSGDSIRTLTRKSSFSYEGKGSEPVLTMYESSMGASSVFETQTQYDSDGRVVQRDRRGENAFGDMVHSVIEFTYDEQGRLSEERVYSDEQEIAAHSGSYYRYTYDVQGRLLSQDRGYTASERPYGSVVHTYSEDGRVETKTNWYGTEEREMVWQETKTRDAEGNVVEAIYDSYRNGELYHSSRKTCELKYA